jgi:RND family efflux transporter MFP subunit
MYSTAKIDSTKLFFNKMDSLVNSITTTNSGYSQSTIDGYNSTINTANTSFNSAISSLASAEKDFKTNASDLGISSTVMDSEQASIKQAIASVESARAVVEKSKLVSPIAGLVTRALPEVGEFISPGEVSFTVMTEDSFKVEVNVPESDIAKISLGNTASITLDAYGDSIVFSADVTMIDPAEVIVEGVPTYKVTLKFNEKDVRIRSGMTANIELITASKEGVISVPVRSVSIREGKRYVKIIDTDGKTAIEKLVVTGIQGSDGNIEIVSGINEGESVIVSVK